MPLTNLDAIHISSEIHADERIGLRQMTDDPTVGALLPARHDIARRRRHAAFREREVRSRGRREAELRESRLERLDAEHRRRQDAGDRRVGMRLIAPTLVDEPRAFARQMRTAPFRRDEREPVVRTDDLERTRRIAVAEPSARGERLKLAMLHPREPRHHRLRLGLRREARGERQRVRLEAERIILDRQGERAEPPVPELAADRIHQLRGESAPGRGFSRMAERIGDLRRVRIGQPQKDVHVRTVMA